MFWFNIYGLIFVAVILIPNIVFAMKCKDGFDNKYQNRLVLALEQAGRFGCFGFMIFSIPGTAFGWWSDEAFAAYLIADIVLSAAYCTIWIVCFKKSSMFRAVALSVIPSVMFIASGVLTRSILLCVAAVIFTPCHIIVSCKNAAEDSK